MTRTGNQELHQAIRVAMPSTLLVDHRVIADGDELALLPEELESFASGTAMTRRASGAARIVARELMLRLGYQKSVVPKSVAGMPVWPRGLVGSLAHDSEVSVAAVARGHQISSLGVDVEPAEVLEPDLLSLVMTENERVNVQDDPYCGRLFFSIKESVYKAVYPLDGIFLDHHDVEVCLVNNTAIVKNGRIVNFRYCLTPRIVAVAFIPA